MYLYLAVLQACLMHVVRDEAINVRVNKADVLSPRLVRTTDSRHGHTDALQQKEKGNFERTN